MLRISRVRKFFSQSLFRRGDGNGMQESNDSSVRSTTDVNAEYEKTFRSKSYLEMYKRFIKTKTPSVKSPSLPSPPLSPSPSISFHRTISTTPAFESQHETLIDWILEDPNLNQDLADFFVTSYKACETCESLIEDVGQIQANHHAITNILKSIKHDGLASLPELLKPFTSVTPQEFRELHETHRNLYRDLTSQRSKTKKRTKLRKFIKRAVASFLMLGSSTLAAMIVILLAHSVIGIVAAPGLLVLCSLVSFLIKKLKKSSTTSASEGLIEQLDVAARGVFMMINDFDSLAQQVRRLNIDIESHGRGFSGDHSDDEFMINELVKNFQSQEARFVEGLEELGKQAVLCLLDIKRSRNQLVEEIIVIA